MKTISIIDQFQSRCKFKYSENQIGIFSEILDDRRRSILLNSVAGSGKSTTIVESLNFISPYELTILLAFNKDIVRELEGKVPSHVKVATLNSWGMKELRFHFGNITLDESKVSKIIDRLIPTWGIDEDELSSYSSKIEKIVNLRRFSLPQSKEELIELCDKHDVFLDGNEIVHSKEVLMECIKDTKTFDFIDQIYVPATNKNMKLKKFKNIFIDECQDLNKAQHEMLRRMVDSHQGRLIMVGDPHQSIYGFAGADANSFDNMRNLLPNTVELPLSVSYRSGVKIIQHAQSLVPHIMPSPNAIEGEVKIGSFKEIQDGDFVLCRNTRPLVALCMKFISEGRKATIKGGDIGKNLINMIKKTKAKTADALFKKLDAEHQKLIDKSKVLYPNKDAEKISIVVNMSDKIEALRTISLTAKTKSTDEIIKIINAIFVEDANGIILSTMHKSKGLEANNVFIIEIQLCPAFYVMKDWQLNQEYNLMYVARTRAKKKLVYVDDWMSDMTKMPFLNKAIAELNIKN